MIWNAIQDNTAKSHKINILKVPNMHRFNIVIYLLLVISNTVISNEDQPKHMYVHLCQLISCY